MRNKSSLVMLLSLFILAFGCQKKEIFEHAERGELLESTWKGSLNTSEIIERITELPSQNYVSKNVTFYSITYRTEYLGKPINSRGLLIIPNDIDSVNLIMYCHGTELPSNTLGAEKITPSLYEGSIDTHRDVRNMGLSWASAGYVVFIPDYIGYGLTLGKDHPYVYYPEMFKSNIDGLLAVKQYLIQKEMPYDNRLFLTGWSQGAGASLSAHKYIQESYSNEFTVVASSGLAGPYHFTRFTNEILSKKSEKMLVTPILSWGLYSLNKFSNIRRPTDQLYSYPVYDQMSAIIGPSTKPEDIFKGHFLSKVIDGTDLQFVNELKINSFHQDWLPVGKVFLHHGDADNLVPYFNSVDAKNGLTASGGDVLMYTYPGGEHDTELGKFILNTLNDFNLLK